MHGTRWTMIPHHPLSCPENDLRAKKQRHPFHVIDGNYYEKPVSNRTTGENVDNAQCSFGPERKLGTVPLETVKGLSAPVMEDWSLEHVETYNPWKVSEMKNIIRRLIGGTKLQRKIFRSAERKRIQALKVAGIIDHSASKEMKGRVIKQKYVCTSELIPKMRRLCLQDFDAFLQSIDFSKLLIRDVKSTSVEGVHVPELIEKVLVQKFKELLLDHLK